MSFCIGCRMLRTGSRRYDSDAIAVREREPPGGHCARVRDARYSLSLSLSLSLSFSLTLSLSLFHPPSLSLSLSLLNPPPPSSLPSSLTLSLMFGQVHSMKRSTHDCAHALLCMNTSFMCSIPSRGGLLPSLRLRGLSG
jgi:hypothetical protein